MTNENFRSSSSAQPCIRVLRTLGLGRENFGMLPPYGRIARVEYSSLSIARYVLVACMRMSKKVRHPAELVHAQRLHRWSEQDHSPLQSFMHRNVAQSAWLLVQGNQQRGRDSCLIGWFCAPSRPQSVMHVQLIHARKTVREMCCSTGLDGMRTAWVAGDQWFRLRTARMLSLHRHLLMIHATSSTLEVKE